MKKILGVIGVGVFAVAAHAAGTMGTTKTITAEKAAQGASVTQPPTEAEIIQILKTANQAEIEAAKLAISKAKSKEVKNFAQHMQKEHSKNTQKGEEIAKQIAKQSSAQNKTKSGDHPRTAEIKSGAQAKVDALKKTKGMEFDAAYVDTQVAMHEQAIADLNNTLIPNAKTEELKSFLETTKTHVQQHLDTAKKLQASLTKWE